MNTTRWPEWWGLDNLDINKDNLVTPSLITNYISDSKTLQTLLNFNNEEKKINAFQNTFLDNIDFLKQAIQKDGDKLNKEEYIVLQNLEDINKKAKITTKKLIEDLFQDFLPKAFKIDNYLKKIQNNDFLYSDYYNKSTHSDWEQIASELYLLSINYMISYYRYIINISKCVPENANNIDQELIDKIWQIFSKIDLANYNNTERNYIWQLLLVIISNLKSSWEKGETIAESFIEHIKWLRIKTIDSSIKKLFKASKYCKQFNKLWILPDQIWMMFSYDDIWELRQVARYFKDSDELKNIWKFNDRWILNSKHDNKDTIKGITPFANTEIVWEVNGKEVPLWELSIRMSSRNQISDIFKKNNNIEPLLYELISKIDFLNHEIYKLSQDIKVLRKLFVWKKYYNYKMIDNEIKKEFKEDKEIIRDTNLDKSVSLFLTKKIDLISQDIKQKLPWIFAIYNKNLPKENYVLIKLIINKVLKEKLEDVIQDIVWEKISIWIKLTSWYKNKKEEEKRKYLKTLSSKFKKKLENNETKLGNYSNEIQDLFRDYKGLYKKIKKTALFYNQVNSNLSWIEKEIKLKDSSNKELYHIVDINIPRK